MKIIFVSLLLFSLMLFGCNKSKQELNIKEKIQLQNETNALNHTNASSVSNSSYQSPNLDVVNSSNITNNGSKKINDTKNFSTNNASNLITNPIVNSSTNQTNQTIKVPVNSSVSSDCLDSDKDNLYVSGIVTYKGKTYADQCTGPDNVKEYLCKKNEVYSYISNCPFNYGCSNGACALLGSSCNDTDSGIDANVSGFLTVKNASGVLNIYKDKCMDIYTIQEYYCDGVNPAYKILPCPSNVTCNVDQGACNFK